jgi:hypothetical protein
MEDIKVKTSGRPRTRTLEVLEDASYDYVDIRKYFLIESKTSLHVIKF